MKIVIAGAGEVGYHLIENLSKENSEITVVDVDAEVLDKLRQNFSITTDHSNIVDSQYLNPSYLKQIDLFLAITNSDETNMIACKEASDAGVKNTICRIKQINLSESNKQFSFKSLGIDWIINPVMLVADELKRMVLTPNIVDSHEFLAGEVMLTGYRITDHARIIGKTIESLEKGPGKNLFQIAIIQRKSITFIPQKKDVIKYDDVAYFIYQTKDFTALRKVLGYAQLHAKSKKVFINGGGQVGLELAKKLESANQDVKVIEQDLSRSYQISEILKKAMVLNFDGTDLSQLKAESLEGADYFISVTNSEQINITSCLLAADQGVERTICLVQQPELVQIIDQNTPISLGISPRIVTGRYLVQFIQGTNVSSYFSLVNSHIEVFEVHLDEHSKCLDTPLKQIELPDNVMIGIIHRGQNYLIPRGESKLAAGDTILLVLHRFDREQALAFF